MPVNWKKQKLWDLGMLCGFILCGAGLLFYSKPVSAYMTQALNLCIHVLLPSLFPFFVLSSMLVSSGVVQRLSPVLEKPFQRLFGLPGCFSAALFLGAVGGYPVGARTAARLYQQGLCNRESAEKALRFCSNAGPAFLIGAVGSGLLDNPRIGVQLYVIHLVSALLIGLFHPSIKDVVKSVNCTANAREKRKGFTLFLQAVTDSLSIFWNVCAFVLFFAVISCLLQQLPLVSVLQRLPGGGSLWYGLLSGALELTSGTSCLANAGLPSSQLLPALSFLCGWGGFSVHFQTISIVQEADLSCRQYLKGKLLHGLLAALLTGIFCR